MFACDHKTLTLSFNAFHSMEKEDLPEYGEFCLLELTDGRYTGGAWSPSGKEEGTLGEFIRGTAETVSSDDVAWWHSLSGYDLTECLEDEEMGWINLGPETEDGHSAAFEGFLSTADGAFPKSEQYCLLILANGGLGAGRWEKWDEKEGSFIWAPALASYDMDEVWAWTPLSSDEIFAAEEEEEEERQREEELNRHPSVDPALFAYGTDIGVYYDKALEKLRAEYPWATLAQMKKKTPWEVVPLHGKTVFGQVDRSWQTPVIHEWTEGTTADEFITFLCEYAREAVKNANPAEKFRYGLDIEVYLQRAMEAVRKDYRWLTRKMLDDYCRYEIRQVDGDWEFVQAYLGSDVFSVCDCATAEQLVEMIVHDAQEAALRANPVTDEYAVPFGRVEVHGWYLEHYIFYRLQTGDCKVSVQAGDRVTGGTRVFFIPPDCFEADSYDAFLDRYLTIVPGEAFGLGKEELLADKQLQHFLGY